MSGIGSQGGFQAPHIPQKSARQAQEQGGAAIAKTTKTVSKPKTAQPSKAPVAQAKPEKQAETAQQKHSETIKDIRSNVAKNRKNSDSFQKRLNSSAANPAKNKNLSEAAAKLEKDKDLKQKATEFAKRINTQEAAQASNIRKPATDKPEVQQNHQIAAQAVQSKEETSTQKKKTKKKDPLDAKLEKIFSLGGERGKKFVAFIQREQAKGPLMDSTVELINDFYLTIKGDSLSTSELLATGEENVNLMRSMVSADNLSEQDSIKDALANAISNSPGERADLKVLRNLSKNQSRELPPSPMQEAKKMPTELAIEFVTSIDFGVIKAPWDPPLMLAS
jgi:hypothetical protein